MEIEMKAKISDEIAQLCVDDKVEFFHITRGGGWEGLFKKDVFYSFNGDAPLKPKNIVRERTEAKITEGEFLDIIHGGYIQIGDMKNFITVKRKNTDCNGVEMNEEYEGEVSEDAACAFRHAMAAANFKPYFSKNKNSVSFYVQGDKMKHELHCEIVNVSGAGPFLEIETIVSDDADDNEKHQAQSEIEQYFWCLGIKEFDKRDWPTIIKEEA